MSELRQNMATKEWVIIASERAKRPHDFVASERKPTHERPAFMTRCPFCPGNERETPDDLLRLPEEGAWRARVFPNKFPALKRGGARVHCTDGVQRKLSGVGAHEVLVETPVHNMTIALQSLEDIVLTLRAFQMRGRDLMADHRVEQIIYFKNHGPAAGTSQEHPHCQILALPMVPHRTRARIEEARRAFDDDGRCPYCSMLEMELNDNLRVIGQNRSFVAFVPYAAPSPFHVWILPRRHGPTFLDQLPHELADLGHMMRVLFGKIYHGLGDPDYNYVIHSAPNRDSSSAYLHWYMSIIPRVTKAAGFELGSGMYINPALPEESAEFLRAQDPRLPADFPKPDTDEIFLPAEAKTANGSHRAPAAQVVQTEEWKKS